MSAVVHFHHLSKNADAQGAIPLKSLLKKLKKQFDKSEPEILDALADVSPLVVDDKSGKVQLQP